MNSLSSLCPEFAQSLSPRASPLDSQQGNVSLLAFEFTLGVCLLVFEFTPENNSLGLQQGVGGPGVAKKTSCEFVLIRG